MWEERRASLFFLYLEEKLTKAISLEEFVDMPFHKQLHLCCQKWEKVNHIPFYENGKMTPPYFQCRAYLNKLSRQCIKNIYVMLCHREQPCSIYDLEKLAKKYQNEQEEKKRMGTQKKSKGYDIDVLDFLRNA